MRSNAVSLIAILSGAAIATPLDRRLSCPITQDFKSLKQSEPYTKDPEIAGGYRCTSNEAEGCAIARSVDHSVSTEYSVSVSMSVGLDIGKIFSLGAEVGFSYTWGTSDSTGQSAEVTCPSGGITCGIQVIPSMVTITGDVKAYSADPSYCVPAGDWDEDFHDFTIEAPLMEGQGADNLRAVMTFEACALGCDQKRFPECVDSVIDSGMPVCPNQEGQNFVLQIMKEKLSHAIPSTTAVESQPTATTDPRATNGPTNGPAPGTGGPAQ